MPRYFTLPLATFANDERPPLPLHGIEGYDGIATTYSAYLTNTAQEGEVFGMPSFGAGVLGTTEGRYMGFASFTESLGNRL